MAKVSEQKPSTSIPPREPQGVGPSLRHSPLYNPHLPVWEHTIITAVLAHGIGDVTSDEAGFLHGVNEVGGGLKHGVVGHEVCGSNTRVVAKDVNCRPISSMSPERRLSGVRTTTLQKPAESEQSR